MTEKCLIDPERDCFGLKKAEELERDLNELRKQNNNSHERFFDRLTELEKSEGVQGEQYKNILSRLGDLSNNLHDMKNETRDAVSKLPGITHKLDDLGNRTDSLLEDVDELKEKPAKKWENVTGQIVAIVIAAVVGLVLGQIGLGG